MVAIGLLDIPPEIQLQIARFVETSKTLKALSVTCRSFRSIAQSLIFESLRIDLEKSLRGPIDDLLANPQICAAIRSLELRGGYLPPTEDEKLSFMEKLSLIQKLLPEMVGLRGVWIYQHVTLSTAFTSSLLEVAAKIPLSFKLGSNVYPSGISSMPSAPLRISHFRFGAIDQASLDFYRMVFHASAATLTELNVRANGDGLRHLVNIDLPCLHTFLLFITVDSELARASAAAFITVQRTIQVLDLNQKVCPLPPLPPSALPDLRELHGPTQLVNQLVPGRPVEVIYLNPSQESGRDWFGEEVTRSTTRVRRLRVHLKDTILKTPMVKRMVTITPYLESLWLSVLADVSSPFAYDHLDSFPIRHSSMLLKFSLPSSTSRTYASFCTVAEHG